MSSGHSPERVGELEGSPVVADLETALRSRGLVRVAGDLGVTPAALDRIRTQYGIDLSAITELEGRPSVTTLERLLWSQGLAETARHFDVTPARLDGIRLRYGIFLMWDIHGRQTSPRTWGRRLAEAARILKAAVLGLMWLSLTVGGGRP